MIKRYGFGLRTIRVGYGESVKLPDIVEQADGEFVRYDDHEAVLESIGAKKTIKQNRKEFEGWYAKMKVISPDLSRNKQGDYLQVAAYYAWQAWKAARGIKEQGNG